MEQALEELKGLTLEGTMIITRAASALRKLESRGLASMEDYPLLQHMDEVINQGTPVSIPLAGVHWNGLNWPEAHRKKEKPSCSQICLG